MRIRLSCGGLGRVPVLKVVDNDGNRPAEYPLRVSLLLKAQPDFGGNVEHGEEDFLLWGILKTYGFLIFGVPLPALALLPRIDKHNGVSLAPAGVIPPFLAVPPALEQSPSRAQSTVNDRSPSL